jgi:signal transduction histidine kinase
VKPRSPALVKTDQEARRVALRLFVPAVATSVLLLLIGILAAVYLQTIQNQTAELLAVEVAGIRASEEMAVTVRQAEIQVHRFVVTGDESNLEPLKDIRRQSESAFQRVKDCARDPSELAGLNELETVKDRFWTELMTKRDNLESNRMTRYMLADELIRALNSHVATNNELVRQTAERNADISRRLAISLLLLGTLGSILGIVFGYAIAKRIRRSIVQLSLSIRDAAGKLDEALEPITVTSGGGAENLEGSLQVVSERVGEVVARLAASQRERMRAEQLASLGRVSAGIAHELRNPIASMKLLIQSAIEKGTPLSDRHLTIFSDEIRRLERLTKSFLDFARPPSLERDRFNIIKVYQQKLLLVSGKLKQKRLVVESDIPNESLEVEADQGQMRQLLLNLLLNAIDASPENGTIHVRIAACDPARGAADRAAAPPPPAGWIVIEFADRGPGLPPVTPELLFEPFFSTKQEGVGLGLPISKQIVEAHGGVILATNRPDGGADFRVELPIAAATLSAADVLASTHKI